jgi:transcriptional regulator with XRE-family HTH domain
MRLDLERWQILRRELREARLRAGLRQADVATSLKRPQSFVAKVESGERKIDLIETLSFCRAVGLDPRSLLERLL